jgi:hypothetical protein
VQQVLASPWRKSVSAGEDVQGVLQPNAVADQSFLHEGSTTLHFGGLYVATLLDRHHPPRILPKSRTARRTVLGRGPHPQGTVKLLARSYSVIFIFVRHIGNFFNTRFRYQTWSEFVRKDELLVSRHFFYTFLSPGLVSLSDYFFS